MGRNQADKVIIMPDDKLDRELAPTPLTVVPWQGMAQRTHFAIETIGDIERYGLERLIVEIERQAQLIAEKGGVSDAKKLHMALLMAECVTQLRAISVQANEQLSEILKQ